MFKRIIITLCVIIAALIVSIATISAMAFEKVNGVIITANKSNIMEIQSEIEEDDFWITKNNLLKIRVLDDFILEDEHYVNLKTKYSFPKFQNGEVIIKCNITATVTDYEDFEKTFNGERVLTLEFSNFQWNISGVD